MKVSYNSLKELVDFDLSPEALAEVLTDTGLEVEGIQEYKGPGNGLEGLVVAKVESLRPHPDADRLRVAQIDAGTGELLQVVCGAPNIAEGQKVILATVNSTLYPEKGEPFKIKKSKIRGEVSLGMICAEDEIGLGQGHDGIMILEESAKIGTPLADYLEIEKDAILEIGLTPNRSDALGHIGVARDIAAALTFHKGEEYSLKVGDENSNNVVDNNNCPVNVKVENLAACPRYSGAVMENIKVAESPMWLKQKLLALGVRPINNIVDVTNFILHQYGQPLHAFDLTAVANNEIVVKNLANGTEFVTLDDEKRKLSNEDLMICNANEPMCMAGVFGGAKSGVKETTTSIFIESAHFEAIGIRRTANRHLLRTDAAQKYEKSTDPELTLPALNKAIELITAVSGGRLKGTLCDYYPEKIQSTEVELEFDYLKKLSGVEISTADVKTILRKLDIEVATEKKEALLLNVPSYRVDVKRPADVVEEIVRIYGLNNIPISDKMTASLSYTDKPDVESLKRKLSEFFAASGFNEMVNNSITQSAYYEKLNSNEQSQLVKVLKSSNSELDTLRSNMIFPVMERIAFNLNRNNRRLKFFEFGQTYKQAEQLSFEEQEHLILATAGDIYDESWIQSESKADIFYLKPLLNHVLAYLPNKIEVKELTDSLYFDYGLSYIVEGQEVAQLGVISEEVTDFFDIETKVVFADVNWSVFKTYLTDNVVSYSELPKYPSVRRDLALLIDKGVKFEAIEKIALEEGKQLLKAVNLFDIYADKKLGADKKSYAVSFVFQDEKKTLTDKQIDKVMKKLIDRYQGELSAQLRN